MNPSYNNGGLGTPGVKPGMITSLPEQPGTPRPMKLGDSKGPNKKLVIAAIFVVVVLVIAMIVVMSMGKGGGNSNTNNNNTPYVPEEEEPSEEEPVSEYKGEDTDFYQYANYILNGTKDAKTIGSYNADKKYAVTTAVENNNNRFFLTASVLWATFYDKISKDARFVEGNKLYSSVSEQNLLMDFFSKYTKAKDWTEEEMWDLYEKDGLENTVKTVRADYEKLQETAYEAGAAWAKAKADWAEAAIKLYDAYKNKGCIKNDEFDQTCIDSNVNDLKSVMEQFLAADSQLDGIDVTIESLAEKLAKNCFAIRDELGSDSEEE